MLNPEFGVGDIAKELGKKWSDADPETKSKYEAMAEQDKARYERVCILALDLVFFTRFLWNDQILNVKFIYFNKLVQWFKPLLPIR